MDGPSRGEHGRSGHKRKYESAGPRGQDNQEARADDCESPNRDRRRAHEKGRTQVGTESPRDETGTLGRRVEAHMRTIYGQAHHNFEPFTYTHQANAVARGRYLDESHKHEALVETYKDKRAVQLIAATTRHALNVLNMHMPLRAAMLGWDMTKVLKAVMDATGIAQGSRWRTRDEAEKEVAKKLRNHKIGEHELKLTAQEGRGTRSAAAIWLLPPAWPIEAASTWLGTEGLSKMLALAAIDLTNRLKEPRESEDGRGRRVVWLPGQATYVDHLYRLRAILNAKCEGRTQEIPHDVKKAFRYFSLRAGIDEHYTVVGEGDLATIAIQKAREAAASERLKEEALQQAATAVDENRMAAQAQAKAEARTQ